MRQLPWRVKPDIEPPPFPLGFKIWMAFCGLVAIGMLGLLAWAVITLVSWVAAQ